MAYYHYIRGNPDESEKKCLQSLQIAQKVRYHKVIASDYNQLGQIACDIDRFGDALRYYLAALKITDATPLPNIRSRILINLGFLHLIQKDSLKALGYYNENIRNAEKNGLNKELAIGYETLAAFYSQKNQAKADGLYRRALRIVKNNKDLYTEFRLYIDLSDLYLRSAKHGDQQKVFGFLKKSKKIQQALKDDSLLFYIYFNLGSYYLNIRQYDNSLINYNKALALSKKNITSGQVINLYKTLSVAYTHENDYKNAFLYKELSANLEDSLFNIKKDKIFNEIQTRYEVDKKNLKIELLTKEQEILENKRKAFVAVAIAILGFLILVLFWYRHRAKTQRLIKIKENKILRHENITLKQDQELKRMKGVIEGQDQERNRLSREIHDGIGGSLAGIKLQLSQVNAVLKNEKINTIEQQMATAFNELRAVSHNLSFNSLLDKNLENLLYKLKAEYESRGEFSVEIVIYPENALGMFSDETKHQVYRIVQELLTNISKHADADSVMLGFTKYDNVINIIVEDNGIGFNIGENEGIGIKNSKDRIQAMKGTIDFESSIGSGTTIIIDIPVNEN